jgi:hypothetical protein
MQDWRSDRAACLAALLLLLGLCAGCGGEERAGKLRSVRSMVPSEEPELGVAELELPDLDAPVEEPAPEPFVANQPPLIRAMQVDPAPRIPGGTDVVVLVDAVDPEGDDVELEYRWFVNEYEVDFEGSVFSTSALAKGDTLRVEAVASDGRAESVPMSSPTLTLASSVPRIVSRPEAPGEDGVFRYQVQVDDREGAGLLRYSLGEAPAGMRVSPARGVVEWAPSPDQAGLHAVEIVVEDADGAEARQRFELTIEGPPAATAP